MSEERMSLHPGGYRGPTIEEPVAEEVFDPEAAVAADEPFAPTPDYESLTKAELEALCEERGLKKSGTKAELIARLTGTEAPSEEEAADVPEDAPSEEEVVEETTTEEEVVEETTTEEEEAASDEDPVSELNGNDGEPETQNG
jgi:hypothetical protein